MSTAARQDDPGATAAFPPPGPAAARRAPDTYWLLEGASLLLLDALGGLYVKGEHNVPPSGPVLLVANHTSYLDPVAIGDASPRRVVFMAKHELFKIKPLGFLLRGVDAFPVRRAEPDRQAVKKVLAIRRAGRVVCIFPEGTRHLGDGLGEPEPGAALFALKTGCPVVPVYVTGTNKMLDLEGRLHRARVTVAFGTPFTFPKGRADREALEASGRALMAAIARTRDEMADAPARRIRPHWIKKKREGSRSR